MSRHPVLAGVGLWALIHFICNGKPGKLAVLRLAAGPCAPSAPTISIASAKP
ncbi:MAG: NnrU family protein [Asticcacaulis sp.]